MFNDLLVSSLVCQIWIPTEICSSLFLAELHQKILKLKYGLFEEFNLEFEARMALKADTIVFHNSHLAPLILCSAVVKKIPVITFVYPICTIGKVHDVKNITNHRIVSLSNQSGSFRLHLYSIRAMGIYLVLVTHSN